MESGLKISLSSHVYENGKVDVTLETVRSAEINGYIDSSTDNIPQLVSKEAGFHTIQERIKRKAKRPSSMFKSLELANGNTGNGVLRQIKNSRKPRNGFGRGLPKKGGAGGKGTWGRPGSSELLAVDGVDDSQDPNYDSDSQENYEIRAMTPSLTEEEVQKVVRPIVLEYFQHGDTSDVELSLEENKILSNRPYVVVVAVTLAMQYKSSHREMTSVLLADLHQRFLNHAAMAEGFDILLRNLPDMILDVAPEAPTMLGCFIARAIADDSLPPMFLKSYKGHVECPHSRTALGHADVLLSMKHGLARLDNVWGTGGGTRPVKYLIKKMVLLLKEYLSSGDLLEAARCLQELEVPHFHHELVYEAVVMVLEDIQERTGDLMCKLLKYLYTCVILTPDQMTRGFLRVYDAMPEICIDVPPAYAVLERFVIKCQQSGFIADYVAKNIPVRGRKRFVSEGDGGRIKEDVPY